ncbi:hypothetical protein AAHN97_22775 [Chitinophaga niabensis]|uniref:hypothetical protein n=1 Tax=Chitinophaga niabensis TaxID=536979 RepID=UPI0031BA87C9
MDKNSEFFTPPEAKYEIAAEEIIKAAKGEPFMQTDWFYRKKGMEIKDRVAFGDYKLENDQFYIVVTGVRCLSGMSAALLLDGLRGSSYSPSFIFINCILPGIILKGSYTNDWIFISTHVNDGVMVDDSQLRNIRIENSRCGYIHIDRSGRSNGVVIRKNSRVGNLKINNSSECGGISINAYSQCGDIEIYYKGECKYIDVHDDSEMGDLKIGNKGVVGKISIGKKCQAGDLKLCDEGRCGNITIVSNGRCKDIRAEINGEIGSIWVHVNSQCGYINIERKSRCQNIWLDNRSQSEYIRICEESECKQILVEENSRCGYIHIDRKSQSGRITITQNSRSDSILIENSSEASHICINDSSQCESVTLDNIGKCRSIEIDNRSLSGPVTVCRNSHLESLEIQGESQSGDIVIDEGDVKKVDIRDNYCNILLRNATASIMKFYNCCLHQLSWQPGTKVELYIDSCMINYLNLHKTSILKDAVMSITNSKIYIAQLQELLVQGQIIFRNIRTSREPFIWQPSILAYVNENMLKKEDSTSVADINDFKREMLQKQESAYETQLEKIKTDCMLAGHKKPLFRIVNSSLGRTEITGGDLTGFNFEYKDSRLLEVFINGAKLPKDKIGIYNSKPGNDLPDEIYFEQKISVYNQLKRIFSNQGDVVTSTWYHSKAMANQERLLSLRDAGRTGTPFSKWWNEDFFNLLNFRLNKMSNNHGESWKRALGFSFFVLFSIYTLYFISINADRPFSWSGLDFFVGNFFSFINISHKMDFIADEEKLNSIAMFLDFFGRVATGYCIYQFVSAFRRHGRMG